MKIIKRIDDGSGIEKYLALCRLDEIVLGLNYRRKFQLKDQSNLKKSIKKRGLFEDFFLSQRSDHKLYLIDGERRYRALKSSGVEEVEVIVAKNLTKDQELQIMLDANIHLPIPKIHDATCMFATYKDIVSRRLQISIDDLIGIDNYFDLVERFPKVQKGYSLSNFAKISGLSSDAVRKAFYAANTHDFIMQKCVAGEIPYSVASAYGRVKNKNQQMILFGTHGSSSKDIPAIRKAVSDYLQRKETTGQDMNSTDMLLSLMSDSVETKSGELEEFDCCTRKTNALLDFICGYLSIFSANRKISEYGTIDTQTELSSVKRFQKESQQVKDELKKALSVIESEGQKEHLERLHRESKKETLEEVLGRNGVKDIMKDAKVVVLDDREVNILPDKTQPRKFFPEDHLNSLGYSMQGVGQLTNVLGYYLHEGGLPRLDGGKKCYQLIAGHCRDKARQRIDRHFLIAKVLDHSLMTPEIIRAIQREEHKLPPTRGEIAVGYARMYDLMEKEYLEKFTDRTYTYDKFYADARKRKIRVPTDLGRDIAFARMPHEIQQLEFNKQLSFSQVEALSVLFNRFKEDKIYISDEDKFAFALDSVANGLSPKSILGKHKKRDSHQLSLSLNLENTSLKHDHTYKVLNSSFLEYFSSMPVLLSEIRENIKAYSKNGMAQRYVYLYFKLSREYNSVMEHLAMR